MFAVRGQNADRYAAHILRTNPERLLLITIKSSDIAEENAAQADHLKPEDA